MKVTVLIPNYNNAPFLKECLESIKNQTFTDFNVLIIDDCSTDNSVEIIENYHQIPIQLEKKEKNSGIIDTLNIGLQLIDSKYILRMDGDDIMHPERIEKLVNFMDKNQDFGACGSSVQHFGISDEITKPELDEINNKTNLLFGHSLVHASVILRNSILKDNNITYTNGYNLVEDYKFFRDLSKFSKMTNIPDTLYLYRREEYNNFKHLDIRREGHLKLYSTILSELEIENPSKLSTIHLELFQNCKLRHSYSEYKKHLKKIAVQNDKLKIYNEKSLMEILNKYEQKLYFRSVEQGLLSFKDIAPYFFTSPKKIYYFIKTKITQ